MSDYELLSRDHLHPLRVHHRRPARLPPPTPAIWTWPPVTVRPRCHLVQSAWEQSKSSRPRRSAGHRFRSSAEDQTTV